MENYIKDYLIEQARRHPSLRVQDIVKLCHQAAFGAEHLLTDSTSAKAAFRNEFSSADERQAPLFELISPEFCRVNLTAWKGLGLPGEWLFRMFAATAGETRDGGEILPVCLAEAEELIAAGRLPVTPAEWQEFVAGYEKGGFSPVGHSPAYREAEKPAYRLAARRFVRLFPLLEKLAALPEKPGARVIALDGRAASGKSSMAAWLEDILGSGTVHMDDFFLPPDLRTEDRLSQPGGNVHYERFAAEVLPHLSSGKAFSYRTFDCARMEYGEPRFVEESRWRIVEGAYSGHPSLGDYADLLIFSDVEPGEQIERIRRRNGPAAAEMFVSRWIPLEEAYFREYAIKESARLIL